MRALVVFASSGAGCTQKQDTDPVERAIPSLSGVAAGSSPSARVAPDDDGDALRARLGLARVPAPAKVLDFVLVPSKTSLDDAVTGADPLVFAYGGGYVERLGERALSVRWLSDRRGVVPNALVIPIRAGEQAHPGQIVLTAWLSGVGLQRAIVVRGGELEAPRVRYLDLALSSPAGLADREDTLPRSTFHVLREAGELGTTVACRVADRVERYVLVAKSGASWLGLGFGGIVRSLSANACSPLALVPTLEPGDSVFVAVAGEFVAAKVTRIEPEFGRVFVKYEFASEPRETATTYTSLATELPR